MSKETIHYLWVGNPSKIDPSVITGHDIVGPIKMAQQLQKQYKNTDSHPIKFWCLNLYVDFYKSQFKQEGVDANIEVCSIEAFLKKETTTDLAEQAVFVQKYMNSKGLRTRVDKINFKDLFSLFLLLSQGGYFFDTNVFPEENKNILLPSHPTVTTAYNKYEDINDFYMMYSPSRANNNMSLIFKAWQGDPGYGKIKIFKACEQNVPFLNVETMGVKKYNYDSERYDDGELLGLFYWVEQKNSNIEEYIKYGDINRQQNWTVRSGVLVTEMFFSRATLLHVAVFYNDVDKVKILLKHGAKLDLKATFTINTFVPPCKKENKELTVKELADFLEHNEISKLLQSQIAHVNHAQFFPLPKTNDNPTNPNDSNNNNNQAENDKPTAGLN